MFVLCSNMVNMRARLFNIQIFFFMIEVDSGKILLNIQIVSSFGNLVFDIQTAQ
jgi:hypothetical protein